MKFLVFFDQEFGTVINNFKREFKKFSVSCTEVRRTGARVQLCDEGKCRNGDRPRLHQHPSGLTLSLRLFSRYQ
jgi:hypothetical protein